MNTIEQLIDLAQGLQDKGKLEESLETFSKALDLIIEDAGKFARDQHADAADIEALQKIKPTILAESKKYLKRDITAAYVLNAMGVLFGQLKDIPNAQQKFTEAMQYIPDGYDFSDPADNLERLANEAVLEISEEEE